jgi:hypothetical protein
MWGESEDGICKLGRSGRISVCRWHDAACKVPRRLWDGKPLGSEKWNGTGTRAKILATARWRYVACVSRFLLGDMVNGIRGLDGGV